MSGALVTPFPEPGKLMAQANYDLYRAETAKNADDVADLGPLDQLPRPWDITTITDPGVRGEAWVWLDAVVAWLNSEYVWDTSDLIPPCWPSHPHLVHELGVLADQRRRAGLAFTSDAMEDWHRYCLPSFIDRMKARYRGFCEDAHRAAPGTARNARYRSTAATTDRQTRYATDVAATTTTAPEPATPAPERPRFRVINGHLIDTDTGEITDDSHR